MPAAATLAHGREKEKEAGAARGARSAVLPGVEPGPGAAAGLPLYLAGTRVRRKAAGAAEGDEHEREADAVAEGLFRHATTCGCGGTCPRCRAARGLLQRKAPPGAPPAPGGGPRFLHGLGPERPLEAASRAFFEPRLGAELGDVRVHTGRGAAAAARTLGAHAYTAGRNIVFGEGRYAPGTEEGDRLLAHELTHVLQQRAGAAGGVQRVVGGDVRTQSITAEWARDLTDAELSDQLRILREHLGTLTAGSAEEAAARANLRVLEDDQNRRTAEAAGLAGQPTGAQALRPGGLPLEGGFQLTPVSDLPAEVVSAIPEGRLVALPPAPAPGAGPAAAPGAGGGALDLALEGSEVLGSAYAGARIPINAVLTTQGFAAAGDTAVGMVAIPRQVLNPLSPHFRMWDPAAPLDAWGHTAMYVRQGGRITAVRGFNPQMGTLSSLLDVARGGEEIVAGARGVASEISADAYLFRAAASRSIEWPVSPAMAEQLASGAPRTGPVLPGSGQPTLYTGDPAAFAAAHPELGPPGCTGSNCGLWAARQLEPATGPIGRPGQPPIMDLGPEGAVQPGAARQGRLIGMLDEAVAAAEVVPPGAVAGRMPGYLRYLKWGGRVFLVVGIASVPLEIALARPEERTRTAVGATVGFAGGLAAGAAAGLVCGPGALLCSVVLGIGFGIAGAVSARSAAEWVYDERNPPRGELITDPAEQRRLLELINRPAPCPNCHRPAGAARDPFAFPPLGAGALAGPRSSRLSPDEMRTIVEWLRANPSR